MYSPLLHIQQKKGIEMEKVFKRFFFYSIKRRHRHAQAPQPWPRVHVLPPHVILQANFGKHSGAP